MHQQVDFVCNAYTYRTLPAGQMVLFDSILDQGTGYVLLKFSKFDTPQSPSSGFSTGELVGIILGSVFGVVALGLGIYCCIKKKKEKLSAQYD